MTAQLFISHSQDDKALYSSLCLALDRSGIARWDVSKLSLGRPLAETLRAAIEECDLCVFLATARSLASQWCLAELGAFWGAGKTVLVYLADPEIAESDLPPQFRGNLWTADASALVRAISESDSSPVRKTANGYCVALGRMSLKVVLGRIEDSDCNHDDCLVALPANEFFDDECISDSKSALGAFMLKHFKEDVPAIQALVKRQLATETATKVSKTPGELADSYGIGKCVFLHQPLGSRLRIAMVSVTTHRADVGLRAEAAYLFAAASSLRRVMANKRLSTLYVPVLGSGHGGLQPEVSLLCMLIAFAQVGRSSANLVKEVNIVVFKAGDDVPSSIPEPTIRRALDFAGHYL